MERWIPSVLCLGLAAACGEAPGTSAPRASALPTSPVIDAPPSAPAAPADTTPDAPPLPACQGLTGAAGDTTVTLTWGGIERTARVHVPATYDASRATPAIFAFHGFTEDAAAIREASHLDRLADAHGFVAVFPEGTNGSWNAGPCCGTAQLGAVDDVGFVKALVGELAKRWCVDARRTFATGFSNGGFLTHRLGCELSETFAAIAIVSGQEGMAACAPKRPVPVLQIHGDADPVVPYDGNAVLGFPSAHDSVAGWASRDGCSTATTSVASVGGVRCDGYTACAAGAEAILCTVPGGGHDWPGGGSAWDGGAPPAAGFVASTYILDFFGRHALP